MHEARRTQGWLRAGWLLAAACGVFWSTTAFRCPGPEPSYAPAGGGGGGGAGSTVTSVATSSVGGMGGATSTSSGPCSPDLMMDPANCGACGRACSTKGTVNLSCTMGFCSSTCAPGLLNLNQPPAPVPDDGCETPLHRVFVTSAPVTGSMNGNMGALGGDTVCQDAASAAGLVTATTWRAWLSDSSSSPTTRFTIDNGVYALLDGTPVAAAWPDLIDGTLAHPIDLDEVGNSGLSVDVWTGTDPNGTLTMAMGPFTGPATECVNWTFANSDVDNALLGQSSHADSFWTANLPTKPCFTQLVHLYCFEQ